MTPYERARIADELHAHVRANPNGRYAQYLSDLGDLYAENAELSAQGKPIKWPPWRFIPDTPFALAPLTREPGEDG